MLTGELPIGKFEPPSRKVQVDVRLDEVVLRALESNPERRYQKASEVKSDVETISSTASAQGNPSASPQTLGLEENALIQVARRQVRWPAFALTIVGILPPVLALAEIIRDALTGTGTSRLGVVPGLPMLLSIIGLFLVVSAGRMRALESYGLALIGPILAVIPLVSPIYLLRLPFGLWALVALTKANVRVAFRQVAHLGATAKAADTTRSRGKGNGRRPRWPIALLLIVVAVSAGWFGWNEGRDWTDSNGKVWVLFPSDTR
jgi:hypothetical protein